MIRLVNLWVDTYVFGDYLGPENCLIILLASTKVLFIFFSSSSLAACRRRSCF